MSQSERNGGKPYSAANRCIDVKHYYRNGRAEVAARASPDSG